MNKGGFLGLLIRHYGARRLKSQFSDVRLLGREHLDRALKSGPVIVCLNHVAWWDAFVIILLEGALGARGYCLMDAENLSSLPFFKAAGALPLDRSSPARSYKCLLRAARVLDGPGKLLFVFPQGEQRPAHLPLNFKRGVEILAKASGAQVLGVALRYDYAEAPRALVHLSAGAPLNMDAFEPGWFASALQENVQAELERIDRALLGESHTSVSLLGRKATQTSKERLPWGTHLLRRLLGGET